MRNNLVEPVLIAQRGERAALTRVGKAAPACPRPAPAPAAGHPTIQWLDGWACNRKRCVGLPRLAGSARTGAGERARERESERRGAMKGRMEAERRGGWGRAESGGHGAHSSSRRRLVHWGLGGATGSQRTKQRRTVESRSLARRMEDRHPLCCSCVVYRCVCACR